ncbi:hypothetical protein Tco_1371601, partial [Tanacetum coccineum]
MSTLNFADTHNMIAFLEKPAESEGFEQIVDFLNANPIKYALTVNPTIFVSCIEQFWTTGVVKKFNGEPQIHAIIDGKKPDMVADEDVIIKRVPKQSNDPLSGKDRLKLQELMEVCTNLQRRVLTLEETKTTQDAEIIYEADLGDQEDASKQGRKIDDIDADIDVTLVNDVVNDDEMFDVDFLNDAEQYVDDVEVTLAQTLVEIKSTKPKVEGIVIQDPSATTTTTVSS